MGKCLLLIEPDGSQQIWVSVVANCDSGPFSRNLGMDLARGLSPGQHLNTACFKLGFKLYLVVLFFTG